MFPSYAMDEESYFIVTAYYSPLPNQQYYITGNYEDEVILNGQGIAWASWKWVFSWMLAAPKSYSFGTKIYLEWLGIWSVEDRGGAIVPAGQRWYSHDRIDVWMWFGDEWLRRAMYWGKRKVKGNIVSNISATNLDYNTVPAPTWAVPKVTKIYGKTVTALQAIAPEEIDIFSVSLWKWSDTKLVSKLQEILEVLWYLDKDSYALWEYDTATIDSIYNLQIETQILNTHTDAWAGSYGPKTRKELQNIYETYREEEEKKEAYIENYKKLQGEAKAQSETIIESLWNISYGDISTQVREFQKIMSQLWYFDYKDTAIFWVKTQNSLIHYQTQNNIISDSDAQWAGIFWPQTRIQLEQDIASMLLLEKILQLESEDLYLRYILWEEVVENNDSVSVEEKIQLI